MPIGIRYVAPTNGDALNGGLSRGSTDAIKWTLVESCLLSILLAPSIIGGEYWVDTTFSYYAGAVFSLYKSKFIKLFESHYWWSLIVCILLFLVSYYFPYRRFFIADNVCAVSFALLIVLVTMRIRVENIPLKWLGQNLFPLYIYQRLPMIALLSIADGYFVAEHEYLYVALSLVITILIAYLYKYFAIKDQHLPRRGKKLRVNR